MVRARYQGTAPVSSRITGQTWANPQFQQCRSPAARCLPLPPQSRLESQLDSAGEVKSALPAFRKSRNSCASPAYSEPVSYRRLDADVLGPPRDLPDSLLKPIHGLRRFTRQRRGEVKQSGLVQVVVSGMHRRSASPPPSARRRRTPDTTERSYRTELVGRS